MENGVLGGGGGFTSFTEFIWIHLYIIKDGDMIYITFMYNVYLNAWKWQLCMYIYV